MITYGLFKVGLVCVMLYVIEDIGYGIWMEQVGFRLVKINPRVYSYCLQSSFLKLFKYLSFASSKFEILCDSLDYDQHLQIKICFSGFMLCVRSLI